MDPRRVGAKRAAARTGQALVEYAIIAFVLLTALMLGGSARVFPGPRGRVSLIDAWHTYYDSFDFLLNGPFP